VAHPGRTYGWQSRPELSGPTTAADGKDGWGNSRPSNMKQSTGPRSPRAKTPSQQKPGQSPPKPLSVRPRPVIEPLAAEKIGGATVVFPCGPNLPCGPLPRPRRRIIVANTEQVGEIDGGYHEKSQSQEEGWRVPGAPPYQGIQSEQNTKDGLACPDAQHKPERAASHPRLQSFAPLIGRPHVESVQLLPINIRLKLSRDCYPSSRPSIKCNGRTPAG
jgi:hypothetical protein